MFKTWSCGSFLSCCQKFSGSVRKPKICLSSFLSLFWTTLAHGMWEFYTWKVYQKGFQEEWCCIQNFFLRTVYCNEKGLGDKKFHNTNSTENCRMTLMNRKIMRNCHRNSASERELLGNYSILNKLLHFPSLCIFSLVNKVHLTAEQKLNYWMLPNWPVKVYQGCII